MWNYSFLKTKVSEQVEKYCVPFYLVFSCDFKILWLSVFNNLIKWGSHYTALIATKHVLISWGVQYKPLNLDNRVTLHANLCISTFCIGVKEPEPLEPSGLVAEDSTSRQPRCVSGQYFFEYLVVVSLKKAKGSSSYEPQITYQFPKVSNITVDLDFVLIIWNCKAACNLSSQMNVVQTTIFGCV